VKKNRNITFSAHDTFLE